MKNLELYLIPFLTAFSLSVIFVFLIQKIGKNSNLEKLSLRMGKRHLHLPGISRLGGVAICTSFLLAIFFDKNLIITKDIWGIILGGGLIFLLGLWDDIAEINWKKQILFQSLAIIIIFICGVKINYITNPWGEIFFLNDNFKLWLGFLLGLFWILILINAMNWLDGIDGISGGIFLIGLLTIFLLSLKPEVNQPPVGILSIALMGSVLAFLIFNFPPARIMAGSSGVFFVGFVLASLSVFAGTKIATTLLILFIPMIDFFWVIAKRLKSSKSIFEPDREHLHHRLLDIGWSQKWINIFFYSITILVAIVALNTKGIEKTVVVSFLIFGMLIFYYSINKKLKFKL